MRSFLVFLAAIFVQPAMGWTQDQEPAQRVTPSGIVLGKDTTIVDGPLRGGVIDFFAVINERAARGVTPANNAAAAFWQAIGPEHSYFDDVDADAFFQAMGVDVPSSEGAWVELSSFVKSEGATAENSPFLRDSQDWSAVHTSWKATNYPLLAKWLEVNERALNRISRGLQRDKWFAPVLAGEESEEESEEAGANEIPPMLIEASLLEVQVNREVSRALIARGMLRAATGQHQQGWADVLACHRLARHARSGASLIELLVGYAIESAACEADAELARMPLSADQLAQMLIDLRELPPLPGSELAFQFGERYCFVDAVMHLSVGQGGGALFGGQPNPIVQKLSAAAVDWNETLKLGNAYYDKLLNVVEAPTYQERLQRQAALEDELKKLAEDRPTALGYAAMLLAGSANKRMGKELGKVLVSLLLPASQAVFTAETRTQAKLEVTLAGLAVAEYRARRGAFPPSLRAVGLETTDPFNGKPLMYRADAESCVVYSVGQDLDDDRGVELGKNEDDAADGDLVMRVRGRRR